METQHGVRDLTRFRWSPKGITHSIVLLIISGCISASSAQESGPTLSRCNTPSTGGLNATTNPAAWPTINPGPWLYVKGFSQVFYDGSQNPTTVWESNRRRQNAKPDWMCGYTYGVRVPPGYKDAKQDYPLVVFLHGGLTSGPGGQNRLAGAFYVPDEDPYILVIPTKLEWDWNAKKILDVITDVKSNLRVDNERVYLTGLSMGGRGTFIVAAAIPQQFAAIMPLSPHHEPFSYVPLAPKISTIPIWMSHGDADKVSSYDIALQMKEELQVNGANITFNSIAGGGHCCWDRIYKNPQAIKWLLNQRRTNNDTAVDRKAWGQIKSNYKPPK